MEAQVPQSVKSLQLSFHMLLSVCFNAMFTRLSGLGSRSQTTNLHKRQATQSVYTLVLWRVVEL